MDEQSFRLLKLMKEDFGELGPYFLSKEVKEMGFEDISSMNKEQKIKLIENVLKNVFAKTMSVQKQAIKKEKLRSIIEMPEEPVHSKEEQANILVRGESDEQKNKQNPLKQLDQKKTADKTDSKTESKPSKQQNTPQSSPKVKPMHLHVSHESQIAKAHTNFYIIIIALIVLIIALVFFNSYFAEFSFKNDTSNISLDDSSVDVTVTEKNKTSLPDVGLDSAQATRMSGGEMPSPDLDGDGIPNAEDRDVDGDGIENSNDLDVDGDGIANLEDPDVDGDGFPNSADADIDGDGLFNNVDQDMDGDGIINQKDKDVDGDSIPNLEDSSVNGTLVNGTDGLPINISMICDENATGTIYFENQDRHFYGCNGAEWKRLDN